MMIDERTTYRGIKGPGAVGAQRVIVHEPGRQSCDLPRRGDLSNHSPDGFQWGYDGSGPAQLALALLAHATGDDEFALATYQQFKREVVATLPSKWTLDAWTIRIRAHYPVTEGAK